MTREESAMTVEALLHHLFPWEMAPGIPRDDGSDGSAGTPPRRP